MFFGNFLLLCLILHHTISLPVSNLPPSLLRRYDAKHVPKITLLPVADHTFQLKYALNIAMMRSYCKKHNYEFRIVQPDIDAPGCVSLFPKGFFFMKHCAVREYLATQPSNDIFVVVDIDMTVGALEVDMSKWLTDNADVSFYTRAWNYEVAAGNYIIRNTEFSRTFLQAWTMFDNHKPTGFSSADNGALHLALLQAVGISAPECHEMYQQLKSFTPKSGHNRDYLRPYYKFIKCTRKKMPVGRIWDVHLGNRDNKDKRLMGWFSEFGQNKFSIDGRITLYNRYHGFAYDAYLTKNRIGGGIPFHHGMKDMQKSSQLYFPQFRMIEINIDKIITNNALAEWFDGTNEKLIEKCAFDLDINCEMRYGIYAFPKDIKYLDIPELARDKDQVPFKNIAEQAKQLSDIEKNHISFQPDMPWKIIPHYDLSGCLIETKAFGCVTKLGEINDLSCDLNTDVVVGTTLKNTTLVKWWGSESSASYDILHQQALVKFYYDKMHPGN